MNNIEDYIDQLVKEKGFDKEDPEVLAQIKKDISERIETRINAMIITSMPEGLLSEFETVLDTDDQEKIQAFIHAHITDVDEKVAAELLQFRAIYLG